MSRARVTVAVGRPERRACGADLPSRGALGPLAAARDVGHRVAEGLQAALGVLTEVGLVVLDAPVVGRAHDELVSPPRRAGEEVVDVGLPVGGENDGELRRAAQRGERPKDQRRVRSYAVAPVDRSPERTLSTQTARPPYCPTDQALGRRNS